MSLAGRFDWHWRRHPDPGAPRAVVAWGAAAPRLHARLLALSAERQAPLLATASRDVLVATGEADDLPWVDGAAYAAPCPDAPSLWLPTLWQPDVPCDLLAQALHRRHTRQPLLLWHQPAALVPLDRQLPVSQAHLERIAAHWQGMQT